MQATEERAESRSAVGSPAWKALESHYKKVRKLHLRKLFADDPTRGERLTASAVGIELDYSKNRITDETLAASVPARKRRGPAGTHRRDVFRQQDQHHGEPRSPSYRVARSRRRIGHRRRAERRAASPRRSSTAWPSFATRCGAAHGRAIPASASATSSISGSAVPISVLARGTLKSAMRRP